MSRRRKSAVSAVATLVIAVALALTASTPALAAPPPWEPDPNSLGQIILYDAAGNVLSGGNNLNHLADYAAVTTAGSVGATRANLIFAAPDHTKITALWTTGSGSASTEYPNASAPAPITGPGFANPVVTLGASDANLAGFLGGVTKDTTAGFANIYQLRVKDSGPEGAGSGALYWASDVLVNEAAGTWTMVYPEIGTTSTSITTVPANGGSGLTGDDVSLSATVTPASNGSVQFFDGATPVGSAHAVTTGSPTATDTHVDPADGTHTYSAKFTPTGGTPVQGSTSPNSVVTIGPPPPAPTANNVSSTSPQALTVDNLASNTITIDYGIANDSNGNPEVITGNTTVVTPPAHGTVIGNSAGSFTYTNTNGTATTDSFVVAGATVTCSPVACSNEPLTGNDITVNVTINPPPPPPSIDGAIEARVPNIRSRGASARLTAAISNVGSVDITVCDTDVSWVASTGIVGPATRPGCATLSPGSSKRFTFIYTYAVTPGTEITLTANLDVSGDVDTGNNSDSETTIAR